MQKGKIMTAAEFFGGVENDRGMGCTAAARSKKRRAGKVFADIKVRMVMRIYSVTCEKAKEILANQGEEVLIDAL